VADQKVQAGTVINAPKVEVKADPKLSDEQILIARKIHDAAVKYGVDPEYALRIGHIENRYNTGPSPAGAIGPMQIMPGTAKDLKIDPNNIDQNIDGGVRLLKQHMDKYKDPYIAGIAYNAGPGVADKFLETNDSSVLPDETLNYVKMLHENYTPGYQIDTGEIPVITELKVEETPGEFKRNDLGDQIGAGAGAGIGIAAGRYSDKQVEAAQKAEAKGEGAAKKITEKQIALEEKQKALSGRATNQQKIIESANKELETLAKQHEEAQKRLAKATDNARRFSVLEENVKTTPGGVTQEGGIGSGAMRHSNTMGEIHEANVVRKGTEAAGSGYSQKSRLIVPDKYASAEIYNPEQKAAQAEFAKAQKEAEALEKKLTAAQKRVDAESNRLRNITEKGPAGLTSAETQLEIAKRNYAEAKVKQPNKFVKTMRNISAIPGASALPGAFAGLDAAEAYERFKQGDIPGGIISGVGAVGGAMSMLPPITPVTAALRGIGTGLSMGAPAVNYFRDKGNKAPEGVKFAKGGEVKKFGAGGKVVAIAAEKAKKFLPTVRGRERVAFPEIYRDPRIIVGESAGRVSKESPLLSQLFGVDRYDLDAMTRDMGHNLAAPYYIATRPPEYLGGLKGKANTQRMQDILEVAQADPRFTGSYGWYQSEPLRQRFIELNPNGARDFDRFSQLGAALSPSTAVPKEIERSSVAYLMDKEGRLSDFLDPRNMPKGYGHAYHTTAHNAGVRNMIERGDFRPVKLKDAPKTRVYYGSRTGENLDVPTADAHFVRGIGLADLRPATKTDDFGSSISATELDPVAQWYRSAVADPLGMRASPAQALQWNAMGTSTGVETELGVPFLELVARRIGQVAEKEGVKPTKVRDEFIRGERHLAEGGLVKGYAEGDYVDLGNSSRTMRGEERNERPYVSRPAWMEGLNNDAPVRAMRKASSVAGTGLDYLKRGLNQFRPIDQAYLIPSMEANLGDILLGGASDTLKQWSKPGEGPITGGQYYVNPVTGEGSFTPVEPDIMGLANVGSLYGMGLSKPVTAPFKMLSQKYGQKAASKMASPYAMVEATSPELLQDTYRMRGTGDMANDPLGLSMSDLRANTALERAGLSKYNVQPGQGAWGGGGESEFNRGYSIKLPRGNMKKSEGSLAQFGSDTDQMMMSAVKFVPQKSFAKSTAIEVKGVTGNDIVRLNKKLGDEFVIQHRPQTNSAVIFNYTDKPRYMGDLEEAVNKIVPNGRVSPGTYESNVIDSSQYASKGAKPKGRKTIEVEQKIINRK
jgi:hypothetical protein